MINLNKYFKVDFTKGNMKAMIIQRSEMVEDIAITDDDIHNFLTNNRIIYGIDEDVLTNIKNGIELSGQTVLATGRSPVRGKDAYLQPIVIQEEMDEEKDNDTSKDIDYKMTLEIPAVRIGEKVGRKVASSAGIAGINVLGEEVIARAGKDFTLRAGKNTRLQMDEQTLYSLIDGQISVNKRTIHVMPTYEVNGDLTLRTGNITFVGNVTIRGNVPSGFEVEAEGDIRVIGTVEGAKLLAGGSIVIGGGIVGQNKSHIIAKGDLQTNFINQGHVEVEGNLNVTQAILHSTCKSSEDVICTNGKGLIIGGVISASRSIQANEIGNDMQTKTELFIGGFENKIQEEIKIKRNLKTAEDDFMKLAKLLQVYVKKEKLTGSLVGREKILMLRVQRSFQQEKQTIDELSVQLGEFNELEQSADGFISIKRMIYPNVQVNFGKYRRQISAQHRQPFIALVDSEVVISTK